MAIFDNDGTSNHEIGKLYDNDGTSSHQIGKVYDNDGTNSYLVYSAEEAYLSSNGLGGGVTGTHLKGNLNSNTNYTIPTFTNNKIVVDCAVPPNNQGQSWFALTPKINLTNIKTLTFTVYWDKQSYGAFMYLGVSSSLPTGYYNNNNSPQGFFTKSSGYQYLNGNFAAGTTTTMTVDVSSLSGSYYICGAWVSHGDEWLGSYYKGFHCSVTSIIGE